MPLNDEKTMGNLLKMLENYPDTYVIREQIGQCEVCGKTDDLRLGVCWGCKNLVLGHEENGAYNMQTIDGSKKWRVRL